jgi:hypothetical protein
MACAIVQVWNSSPLECPTCHVPFVSPQPRTITCHTWSGQQEGKMRIVLLPARHRTRFFWSTYTWTPAKYVNTLKGMLTLLIRRPHSCSYLWRVRWTRECLVPSSWRSPVWVLTITGYSLRLLVAVGVQFIHLLLYLMVHSNHQFHSQVPTPVQYLYYPAFISEPWLLVSQKRLKSPCKLKNKRSKLFPFAFHLFLSCCIVWLEYKANSCQSGMKKIINKELCDMLAKLLFSRFCCLCETQHLCRKHFLSYQL